MRRRTQHQHVYDGVRKFSAENFLRARAVALASLRHTRTSLSSGGGRRGFTLLLAALIASTVLSLGSSIFVIAQKQVILSSSGRDSQFAFYAADAGSECALYWDMRQNGFDTIPPASQPICDGQTATETVISGDRAAGPPYAIEMKFDMFTTTSSGAHCVDIVVTKNTTDPKTKIRADGYSVSCAAVPVSPRALQRSVELYY